MLESTINGTEAEDQAIQQGYQNTDKQEVFRFPMLYLGGSSRGCPLLRASSDIHAPSKLARISPGWWLIDLLLRASNEGLRRPRVARAQKIISLHPRSCLGGFHAVQDFSNFLHQHGR